MQIDEKNFDALVVELLRSIKFEMTDYKMYQMVEKKIGKFAANVKRGKVVPTKVTYEPLVHEDNETKKKME